MQQSQQFFWSYFELRPPVRGPSATLSRKMKNEGNKEPFKDWIILVKMTSIISIIEYNFKLNSRLIGHKVQLSMDIQFVHYLGLAKLTFSSGLEMLRVMNFGGKAIWFQ